MWTIGHSQRSPAETFKTHLKAAKGYFFSKLAGFGKFFQKFLESYACFVLFSNNRLNVPRSEDAFLNRVKPIGEDVVFENDLGTRQLTSPNLA